METWIPPRDGALAPSSRKWFSGPWPSHRETFLGRTSQRCPAFQQLPDSSVLFLSWSRVRHRRDTAQWLYLSIESSSQKVEMTEKHNATRAQKKCFLMTLQWTVRELSHWPGLKGCYCFLAYAHTCIELLSYRNFGVKTYTHNTDHFI